MSTMRSAPFSASRPVKRLRTKPIQNSAPQPSAAVMTRVEVAVLRVATNGINGTTAPRAKEMNEDSAAATGAEIVGVESELLAGTKRLALAPDS